MRLLLILSLPFSNWAWFTDPEISGWKSSLPCPVCILLQTFTPHIDEPNTLVWAKASLKKGIQAPPLFIVLSNSSWESGVWILLLICLTSPSCHNGFLRLKSLYALVNSHGKHLLRCHKIKPAFLDKIIKVELCRWLDKGISSGVWNPLDTLFCSRSNFSASF